MSSSSGSATAGSHTSWAAARGRIRPDLIYLGWQPVPHAAKPDPPPHRLPAAAGPDAVSGEWAEAQRREYLRLSRPSRLGGAASLIAAAGFAVSWLAGALPAGWVLAGIASAVASAAHCVRASWRERSALVAQLRAEELRIAAFAHVQSSRLAAREALRTQEVRAWKQRNAASRHLPHWCPVTLPTTVNRIDIAGGTLTGWSAVVTMLAAPRLAAGGEVTVLDLTEGGVATDLLAVARRAAVAPLVWLLPADLPLLELGTRLPPAVLADVLAQTVSAADGPVARGAGDRADPAVDAALISGIFQAIGDGATIAQLVAGLRALGQMGGPEEHLAPGGLTHSQLVSLSNLAGRTAGHIAAERAWAIEARLRALAMLGTSVAGGPDSPLKVAWLDRRAAAAANGVLAAYLVIASTAALRQASAGQPWQQTICVLGAERLASGVLDRLCDATEIARTGLVLCYRTIPPHVAERLGRGDAAVGFMRLGNAAEARLAAEHIGTEHRFVVSQLTDTVGVSISDSMATSYTSTVGTAESVTESGSVTQTTGRSRSHSRPSAVGPVPMTDVSGSAGRDRSSSAAVCDSRSITAGITTGTSWGWTTSRAVGGTDSAATTMQRSRESLVEQHELQQLPHSAVLLCYPAPGGRQVLLADANPAIMGLPSASLAIRRTSAVDDRLQGAPVTVRPS